VAAAVEEIVETGWAGALAPVAGQIATTGDFLRAEIAAGRRYLPAGTNILRAFTQPFDQVRVLIVAAGAATAAQFGQHLSGVQQRPRAAQPVER
jgi:uracil DNA glycosylase